MALAIADEEGGLITADDPAVIHRLLTLVAGAGRDLVGLGVKEIFGALLAIGADRPLRLVDDVALGSWIGNVTLRNPGLVEVAAARLGADIPERRTPLQTASLCAVVALASRAGLDRELRSIGSERLYREIELPLTEVLARMEGAGIAVDQQALAQLGWSCSRTRITETTWRIALWRARTLTRQEDEDGGVVNGCECARGDPRGASDRGHCFGVAHRFQAPEHLR
jgi:hypothetical protein